jgi:long-chain acyl-CoA synthetase
MNMGYILEDAAQRFGEKTAIILDDQPLSFVQLNELANRVGNGLKELGVRRGERVSLLIPNSLESISSFYAIMKIGAVINPLNPLFKGREIKYILNHSEARVLITTREQMPTIEELRGELPSLEQVVLVDAETYPHTTSFRELQDKGAATLTLEPCDDDHPVFLVYTSGTTGLPKGATITHRNCLANAQLSAQAQFYTRWDRVITALPVFHLFGGNVVLQAAMLAGATLCVLSRFEARTLLDKIDQVQANVFVGVPTMFVYLNRAVQPGEGQSLERAVTGGAPMPLEVMREFEQKFNARMLELYGLTEVAGAITCNPFYYPARPRSVGLVLPPVELKLVDPETGEGEVPVGQIGELCARGPVVMKEYWRMPEETAQAIRHGWFYTGDLAQMDEEGFVYLKGRKKEMLIVGGYNVYPVEVEDVLYEHPAVAEAAVVGMPDEKMGEIPKAFVVLRAGESVRPEDITAYCAAHLAAYKVPRQVAFIRELPKSPVGKILKRVLKEQGMAQ